MYGSSVSMVTLSPRDSRIAAREAAAIPLPKEDTTPPVTNTNLVIALGAERHVREIQIIPQDRPGPRFSEAAKQRRIAPFQHSFYSRRIGKLQACEVLRAN